MCVCLAASVHPKPIPDLDVTSGISFGPSHIPPRIYLTMAPARTAIREEIFGLLRRASSRIPAVKLIDYSRSEYRTIPRIRTSLLVKLKAGARYKAGLVLRGDQESILRTGFVSAPTAGRELLKIALSVYVLHSELLMCKMFNGNNTT